MCNIYRERGYADRDDYLNSLVEDYGVPYELVQAAADTLGSFEDFDGLVSILEDASYMDWPD